MARADDEAIGGQPFYPEGSAEFRCREISQTHSWSRQAEPVVWVSLNRLASIPVVLDVKAHGLEDAFLGCLNRFAEAVNTGKIIAVGEVLLSLAFNGNGVAVESHARCKLTMHTRKFAIRRREEESCGDW